MAKDVPNKSVSSSSNNTTDNTSPPISDQQKVPPLRIVLNTSGNQKSSSTAITVSAQQQSQAPQQQQQQQEIKREKSQDGKTDGDLKTTGRVRIKLGTNKQQRSNTNPSESSSNNDSQRNKSSMVERTDISNSQESTTNLSHLRRITRRSQRTVQTVNNEDEESISSMTSTDENQNTTNNNNNSDINSGQDTASTVASSNQSNANSNSSVAPITTNSSSNAETPRRYKRRKGEQPECQPGEQDGAFNFQNYKLPIQNSFELYKNIRKQVDKKLKNLICIHPKTPYGFRDYMLNRGAYLLDGNKLGNGTNLFMNEDGGLHPAPMGKYHALRHGRINYSVPNRAKVPLGLAVNSPLYNLFIEQEKERYKMRMQHIKEREKLTLAAEQEIIRVYNQAAMAAANQLEPFSACTMLKHQEIYNYLDSDGVTILASDDAQQEQASNKQEEARSRRRHHEQISSPTTRKGSNAEESSADQNQKNSKTPSTQTTTTTTPPISTTTATTTTSATATTILTSTTTTTTTTTTQTAPKTGESQKDESDQSKPTEEESSKEEMIKIEKQPSPEESEISSDAKSTGQDKDVISEDKTTSLPVSDTVADEAVGDKIEIKSRPKADAELSKESVPETDRESKKETGSPTSINDDKSISESHQKQTTYSSPPRSASLCVEDAEKEDQAGDRGTSNQVVPMEQESESQVQPDTYAEHVFSDDDRQAYNKEIFLSQLQDIDDKWDKIRNEMLIRHRNEAESLYAVQRLEWEWKTKEIGACDVRTTPVIDDILVPRLNIYSQDY